MGGGDKGEHSGSEYTIMLLLGCKREKKMVKEQMYRTSRAYAQLNRSIK